MMTTKLFAAVLITLLLVLTLMPGVATVESKQTTSAENPLHLVVSDIGSYVQLNWDVDPGRAGFNVYRTTNTADDWEKLNEVIVQSTSFVDYSAPRPALLHYKVTCVDANGEETSCTSVLKVSTQESAAAAGLTGEGPSPMALSYSKDNIITDGQLTNSNTMTSAQIQTFLTNQGSVLATYSVGGKTAAQHIYDSCQTHGINPQVILVTLQKEKGLIRSGSANPNNFAMGWSTWDSSVIGFADQINFGTRQFRLYLNNITNYGWVVGQAKSVSDGVVTAANTATAGLYVYTPWIGQGGGGQVGIGGNYLFWDLWRNTFAFEREVAAAALPNFQHPLNGTWSVIQNFGVLNNGFGGYHLAEDAVASGGTAVFAFANGTVKFAGTNVSGYGGIIIIEHNTGSEIVASLYGHLSASLGLRVSAGQTVTKGQHIAYVAHDHEDGGSWGPHLHFGIRKGAYSTQQICGFWPYVGYSQSCSGMTHDQYKALWYDPTDFINGSTCGNGSSESFRINGGPPVHPNGTLIKVSSSGTVYVLQNGQKRGITSETVLRNLYSQSNGGFDFKDVITVASDEFNNYPTGSAVSSALSGNGRNHPDGRLISNSAGEVSIVTNGGGRRPFASSTSFTGLGYLFCNVIPVSSTEYNSYTPVGPIVDGSGCPPPGSFSLNSPSNGQSVPSTTSVTLSWGASSNASSYDVHFGTSSNPGLLASQTGTSRSVSVTPGQTYFWKVVAKVSCGSATVTTPISQFSVQQQNFTISLSASPSNGGNVSGGGTFSAGSSRTVTANPNSGFSFANWTENGSIVSSSPSLTFTLNSNRNLVANFTQDPVNFTIALSASPSHGGNVSGAGAFPAGGSFTVFATANSGFSFLNWTENGNVVSTSPSYTFTLSSNRNLVANFLQDPSNFTISVSASPGTGGNVSGGGTFVAGTLCTVTAIANGNFSFTNWTENGSVVSSSSTFSFTVNGDRNLVANFTASSGGSPVNFALVTNGGVATASSTLDSGRSPVGAINGDRMGQHWGSDPGTGSGWHDATSNAHPDWLQVDFNGVKTIEQIDVYTLQDNFQNPVQPTSAMTFSTLGITAFDVQYWNGSSWVNVPGGIVTGNNKVWRQFSALGIQTSSIRVLVNGALNGYSRIVEVEAWSSPTTPSTVCRNNVALASSGAVATASSTLDSGRAPLGAINGDRMGQHWGTDPNTGSGWHDATTNAHPDWLQVDFNGVKTIDEIGVYTLQDNFQNPSEPNSLMTFTTLGITAFEVQYWNGASWVTVPGGGVSGNNKVWRQFTGLGIQTSKIRVLVNGALNGYSRIVEVEAWGTATAVCRNNVALASNGGIATASSTLDSGRGPSGANNGDRMGQHWGTDPSSGSGWHDATSNSYPDWLQVDFNGVKTIDEINVYTLQDNFQNPVEPNSSMTFSTLGVTAFEVQYWNGSSWVTVPGGSVSGNNKVWRQFTGLSIQTSKIRVLVNGALNSYSRIVEVEAWGSLP